MPTIKIMFYFYNLIFYLALPGLFIRLWLKQNKNKGYQKYSQQGRWKERLGLVKKIASDPIWIHSVSVGEFIAVLPLIQLILKEHPQIPIFITTTTQTGSDLVIKSLANKVSHSYIPWDLPDCMARFYQIIKPRAVVIMETEIWPNLLYYAKKSAIPVFLINARMSEKSQLSYQKIAGFSKEMMSFFTHICAQNNVDQQRFISLGLDEDKISVTGNIKFDLTIDHTLIEQSNKIKQQLDWKTKAKDQKILLISSSHEGEDQIMLDLYSQLKSTYPQLKLILVPRHPERFLRVKKMAEKSALAEGFTVITRSTIKEDLSDMNADILIGDSLGEMTLYYQLADIVIMGGTFIEHGGHNILEPAALSKAIFYGASMYNFATINTLFLEKNASVQVLTVEELQQKLDFYLQNPKKLEQLGINAKQIMDNSSGSKDKIYQILGKFQIFKQW